MRYGLEFATDLRCRSIKVESDLLMLIGMLNRVLCLYLTLGLYVRRF